jgi:DNA-binding HxlR family transcriptional regulator
MEIKGLRADMNMVEETVLKERLRAVEDTLSQNHLLVYAGQRSQSLNQDIAILLKDDCQNRDKCLEHYKNTIEDNTQVIKQSGPKLAIADLDDRIAENELMVEKTKGQQCGNCFSNFDKKLKREKRAYQEIVLVKDINNDAKVNSQSLDIPFLLQTLFEPLGNESRLKILAIVYEGKRSFSELSKIVDLKAGHLAFHLKKLVYAKLISQEASKGDYIITQKGLTLVKEMLTLQKQN